MSVDTAMTDIVGTSITSFATSTRLADTARTMNTSEDDGQPFVLRPYQDEMLEESLKRNSVVVLDTGAGKTHM